MVGGRGSFRNLVIGFFAFGAAYWFVMMVFGN
jgi:hypothetical protein